MISLGNSGIPLLVDVGDVYCELVCQLSKPLPFHCWHVRMGLVRLMHLKVPRVRNVIKREKLEKVNLHCSLTVIAAREFKIKNNQ